MTEIAKQRAGKVGRYGYHAAIIAAIVGAYLGVPTELPPVASTDPALMTRIERLERAVDDPELRREVAELRREAAALRAVIDVYLALDGRKLGGGDK